MIDNRLSIAVPAKIEWVGARHGLVVLSRSPRGLWWLKNAKLITRGGKILDIEDQPRGASEREFYATSRLPRPIFYMHPRATFTEEDEAGVDRSGYCILYDGTDWIAIRYLNRSTSSYSARRADLAYTPDSQGQAIAFSDERRVLAPLKILEQVELSGESVDLPPSGGAVLIHSVSPDGRFRVKADLGSFFQWFLGIPPEIYAYTLSGERGSITATPAAIQQLSSTLLDEVTVDEGEGRIISHGVLLPAVGMCADPASYSLEHTVTREPSYLNPDYRRDIIGFDSEIDFFIGDTGPSTMTTLRMLYKNDSTREAQDYAEGQGSVQWGASCESGSLIGQSVVATSQTTTLYTVRTEERHITFGLYGWGGGSEVKLAYNSEIAHSEAFTYSDGDLIETDRQLLRFPRSAVISLDGTTILSKTDWTMNYPRQPIRGISYGVPRAVDSYRGFGTHENSFILQFVGDPTSPVGADFVEVQLRVIDFNAQGVYALAVLITSGTITEDPPSSNVSQRVIVSRIFGFGTSVELNRELTEEEMNSRLFIAYDPVLKQFSDLYTSPVYYQ